MKFATLKSHSRDGRLVLVSRDLRQALEIPGVPNLQYALDRWDQEAPSLQRQYLELNTNRARGAFDFDPQAAHAPLPRAYQWLDCSSFLAHGRLLDRAFGIAPIPMSDTVPITVQGAGDAFLGPYDDVPFPVESEGIDFEAEFGVILGDVPMGVTAAQAVNCIRLAVVLNDWGLRTLQKFEMQRGFGLIHCKPATSFAPVAVTLDELGNDWRDEKIHLRMNVEYNGKPFGHPSGGAMDFKASQLIVNAARTRELRAGTVLGFGTTSEGDPKGVGSACLTEKRGQDIIDFGEPRTPFMKYGERVRIEAFDAAGNSMFGAIDQRAVKG
ncbi:MAG TPA: fumarylacetoacetate hydrolase family protein [Steroidobacteraceae bacterium]|nr:fumarylacetoacetate hydrolase family protein [Steroidobacteraceae bacterium]